MAGGFFDLSTGTTVNQVTGRLVFDLRNVMTGIDRFDLFRATVTLTDAPWSLASASAADIVSTWNDLAHFRKIWNGTVQARNQADTAFENYDFETFAKRLYGPRVG